MGDVSKGKIFAKKGDNKAFAFGKGDWYNIDRNSPDVEKQLANIEKGTEVEITYNKSGAGRYVTSITVVGVKPETKPESKSAEWTPGDKPKEEKRSSYYGSPEDVAGKQVGCALGAAASIVSNPNLDMGDKTLTPENAAQVTLYIAKKLLEWMQAQ